MCIPTMPSNLSPSPGDRAIAVPSSYASTGDGVPPWRCLRCVAACCVSSGKNGTPFMWEKTPCLMGKP